MPTPISPLSVRRAILIHATPERIWREFESLERMQKWFGTGHSLVAYEPRVGATVETDAAEHEGGRLIFAGKVTLYDPPHELTFEQDWIGQGWAVPALVTIRLTPHDDGTLVELFHHGFERLGGDAAEHQRGFESGWTIRQLEALRQIVEA